MPFESLYDALADLFEKPFSKLPSRLSEWVEKEYGPISWDQLSVDQRRMRAEQWDYQNDPALESDRQYWSDFYLRMQAIEAQIEQWTNIATPTATDLAQQESKLEKLKRELAAMERQEQQNNVRVQNDRIAKEQPNVSKLEYIAYPKAMSILSARLNATPEELAAWIFLGPKEGGLAAYQNANELDPPPIFYYSPGREGDFDCLSPLMSCWFSAVDIEKFQPAERYITGEALIERWSKQQNIKPKAYILAKIRESRLMDMHPICGGTEATFSGMGLFPQLEAGLFSLSQIEEIEQSDFSSESDIPICYKPDGHLNHDPEMQKMANEIAVKLITATGRVPTKDKVAKLLADEIGTPFDTVLRRIRAEWKKKSPPKYKTPLHK